jgi:hypothetical protein
MFLIYLLAFLLSWLCGLFVILVSSFLVYEEFSIVDIASFGFLSFAVSLVLVPLVYRFTLKLFFRKIIRTNQFIYFPVTLILVSNLPVYFLLWYNTGDLFGPGEAFLLALCFIITAVVYGLCAAWIYSLLNKA